MPEFMTTAEVAELLRVPEVTVRYWRHNGTGPRGFKVGRHVRYAREDVDKFVDQLRGETVRAAS